MNLSDVEAFFRSYEQSVLKADIDLLVSHYAEPFVGMGGGQIMYYPTRAVAKANSESYLARLKERGLTDMNVIDVSFTAVSDRLVLSYPVWEVRPREGGHWHFRNVYGLSRHPEGVLAELAIGENEGAQMASRYPELFR